jgi:ribosomal protein S18 acetylase RimI-like enzyme
MTVAELARAFERLEIRGMHDCVESARALVPGLGAAVVEFAGGAVAFAGVDSPLSQATGFGMEGPVSAGDVARVTEFYAARGSTPAVMVNPCADPSLGTQLAHAGYAPVEYENTLFAELLGMVGRRDERIAETTDFAGWAQASARAFLGTGDAPPADFALIGEIIASASGVIPLEGRGEGGTVEATGAMGIEGEYAGLFASSTLPAFRRRGWQTALILDRVARACAAGVRYARASAGVGSASEANFRRCGFRVLYTRASWQRK